MAPSRIDLRLSGMTRAGSTFIKVPKPVHFSQAPKGLMKLNIRGVSSSTEMPCSGQA